MEGDTFGFSANYAYFVGTEDIESDTSGLDSQPWKYLPGEIDEINVSSIARSGDWIQTQYNNQSSPSTFYTFYSPNAIQVAPSSINLYASQSEQFTVPGTCDSTIAWSLPAGSLGTLTASGLYTAPPVVPSQQTVSVSAMSQSNGSSFGSAQVTLLSAPQPLTPGRVKPVTLSGGQFAIVYCNAARPAGQSAHRCHGQLHGRRPERNRGQRHHQRQRNRIVRLYRLE